MAATSILLAGLGLGPLARQLQSQGLAAAAEYQKARAAVDDILERIASNNFGSNSIGAPAAAEPEASAAPNGAGHTAAEAPAAAGGVSVSSSWVPPLVVTVTIHG